MRIQVRLFQQQQKKNFYLFKYDNYKQSGYIKAYLGAHSKGFARSQKYYRITQVFKVGGSKKIA